MAPHVLIVVNVEWYFWSHRLPLAKALRDHGCQVTIAAGVERGYQQAIEREGFRFIPLHLKRRSSNPWRELASLSELFQLYRKERPDLVHHITIKPVLYGSGTFSCRPAFGGRFYGMAPQPLTGSLYRANM